MEVHVHVSTFKNTVRPLYCIYRYLQYTSHHLQSCQNCIALKKNLGKEERHVKEVLKGNGYIESIIRSAKRLKKKRKEEETPK